LNFLSCVLTRYSYPVFTSASRTCDSTTTWTFGQG
jgi:hypothetical protein